MRLLFLLLIATFSIACTRDCRQKTSLPGQPAEGPLSPEQEIVSWLQKTAVALDDNSLDAIAKRAAERKVVLLGESTHGTREYYELRAELSKRLLANHGFRFVAVEGDWDAIAKLNQRIQGEAVPDALTIMQGFTRWPQWMWANHETAELVEALREINAGRKTTDRIHLYGVDIYGAAQSARRVAAYLGQEYIEAWPCLAMWLDDRPGYIRALGKGEADCRNEAQVHIERLSQRLESISGGDQALFDALMNARVVKAAEGHYRAIPTRGAGSWNSRAGFFAEAMGYLFDYHGEDSRGIFWGHNTHIGDSAATAMREQGKENIGRQVRARYGDDAVWGIGFGTFEGDVLAGRRWDAPMQTMRTPPPAESTWESLMGKVPLPRYSIELGDAPLVVNETRGHRAVGVVYDPGRDEGAYVPSRLKDRYNAFIFVRETTALLAFGQKSKGKGQKAKGKNGRGGGVLP